MSSSIASEMEVDLSIQMDNHARSPSPASSARSSPSLGSFYYKDPSPAPSIPSSPTPDVSSHEEAPESESESEPPVDSDQSDPATTENESDREDSPDGLPRVRFAPQARVRFLPQAEPFEARGVFAATHRERLDAHRRIEMEELRFEVAVAMSDTNLAGVLARRARRFANEVMAEHVSPLNLSMAFFADFNRALDESNERRRVMWDTRRQRLNAILDGFPALVDYDDI